MKKGTKIGWALIAMSIVLSVWVIVSQSSKAVDSAITSAGFTLDSTGTILTSYDGSSTSLAGNGQDYTSGNIPASVTTIGTGFLANNGNVTSVSLPDTVTTLQTGAFTGSYVGTVTMSNVTAIPDLCFSDAYQLTSLTLPETVTSIGSQAFQGTSLTSLSIPASVSNIDLGLGTARAFNGASELTSISVAPGSSNYASSNGCLYSSTGRLLAVPEGYTTAAMTLPSSATGISSYAFDGASNVRTVDIPSTVSGIDSNAFTNSSVEKITIRNRNLTLDPSIDLPAGATVEGYTGSTAQTFAENNGYTFLPLDGNNTTDPNQNNNNNNNNGTNTDPNNNNNNNNNGGNTNNNGTNTNGGNTNNGANTNGGGTNSNGTKRPSSNTGSTGNTHTTDNTPKTADGDLDPRFAIALAIFAGGLAMIILSRRQRAVIVKNASNSGLDD